MTDTPLITQDELAELFGDRMPMEAVQIIFNGDGTRTIGQVRDELRSLARRLKPTNADNARVAQEPVDDYPLYPHRLFTQDQLNASVRSAVAVLEMQLEVVSEALAEKAKHLRNATERAQIAEAKLDAAVRAERERCARIADAHYDKASSDDWGDVVAYKIAVAIREGE